MYYSSQSHLRWIGQICHKVPHKPKNNYKQTKLIKKILIVINGQPKGHMLEGDGMAYVLKL